MTSTQDNITTYKDSMKSPGPVLNREQMRAPQTALDKCCFIEAWSDWFYNNTNTFDGALGRQLAYLWPAIVKGNQIEVTPQSAIVKILRRKCVPTSNPIWKYIDVVSGG